MILDRFPELRRLTVWEIETLAQDVVMRVARVADREGNTELTAKLNDLCHRRDVRMEELRGRREAGLDETELSPEPNEEQRAAMLSALERQMADRDFDAQMAIAFELYEIVAREEDPPDPILVEILRERQKEADEHPERMVPCEVVKARLEKISARIARRRGRK